MARRLAGHVKMNRPCRIAATNGSTIYNRALVTLWLGAFDSINSDGDPAEALTKYILTKINR